MTTVDGESELAALCQRLSSEAKRSRVFGGDLGKHEPVVPVTASLLNGLERRGEAPWSLR